MGLNKKESQFFEMLVSFDQAKTSEVKNYYLEMVKNFRGGERGKLLSDGQYVPTDVLDVTTIRNESTDVAHRASGT